MSFETISTLLVEHRTLVLCLCCTVIGFTVGFWSGWESSYEHYRKKSA